MTVGEHTPMEDAVNAHVLDHLVNGPVAHRDLMDAAQTADKAIAAQGERIRQLEAALRDAADEIHDGNHVGFGIEDFTECAMEGCIKRCEALGIHALLAEQPTCQHAFDESVIEGTPTGGVVCRKCGAEGAVYR